MFNGQITRIFSEKFDMYLGVENALSYTQQHPIVDAQNPFGTYFDSSMVWAPIFGRMFYIGLRYTLK
jgi:outer membrane receptor for ferrienterochelin and colicins